MGNLKCVSGFFLLTAVFLIKTSAANLSELISVPIDSGETVTLPKKLLKAFHEILWKDVPPPFRLPRLPNLKEVDFFQSMYNDNNEDKSSAVIVTTPQTHYFEAEAGNGNEYKNGKKESLDLRSGFEDSYKYDVSDAFKIKPRSKLFNPYHSHLRPEFYAYLPTGYEDISDSGSEFLTPKCNCTPYWTHLLEFWKHHISMTYTPVTSKPITLSPITPSPVTVTPVTSRPITSDPVTSEPITSAPITPGPIAPVSATSGPTTPAPVTSEPITSEPITPVSVTSGPVTSPPVTTEPITSISVTLGPITSAPITTEPITIPPVTSEPITSVPVTSGPITPPPVSFEPITSSPVTSKPITSVPVTPESITLVPVTPEPITSPPVTSGPITSRPVTLEPTTTDIPPNVTHPQPNPLSIFHCIPFFYHPPLQCPIPPKVPKMAPMSRQSVQPFQFQYPNTMPNHSPKFPILSVPNQEPPFPPQISPVSRIHPPQHNSPSSLPQSSCFCLPFAFPQHFKCPKAKR